MVIKKGDFVEIDYIGRLQENGRIFDLTSEELAKQEGIHNPKGQYGARIICVGEGQIVKGLDDFLIGKSISTHKIALTPEQGFGKKNPKLMKLVPLGVFKKQNLKPFPGLQVNFDGYMGTVKTVSGGRVIVDFNHPLAGRDVEYQVTVKRIVKDVKEKVGAFLQLLFGRDVDYTFDKGTLTMKVEFPEQMQKQFTEHMKKVIPNVKKVVFSKKQSETKKVTTQK